MPSRAPRGQRPGRPATIPTVSIGFRVLLAMALVALALAGCGSDDRPPASGPSDQFVPSAGDAPATLWAIGDAAAPEPEAKAVARLIAREQPDRLLYLGDVYETGTAEEFTDNYDRLYGDLADITAPTAGNHEWANRAQGYDAYWKARKGRTPPLAYSFRLAGWEILSLNAEAEHGPGSAQVRWLRRAVAEPGDCRLAFWHEPRYSAGLRHGDEDSMAPFWQSLRGRAKLVVSGHEHDMQRLEPRGGLTQLVSGAGGHSSYEVDEQDGRLAFADDETDGALRIQLRPGAARLDFVATDGRVLDSSTVRCRR